MRLAVWIALLASALMPTVASADITGPPEALEMVALMAVPKPDAQIMFEACPDSDGFTDACSFDDGRVYVQQVPGYPARTIRANLYHELGHRYATARILARFRQITGMQRRSAWLVGERFADAYANCAFDALPGSWRWVDGYDYNPTRRVQRRVCGAIWSNRAQ